MKKPGRRRFLPTDEDRFVADVLRRRREAMKLSQADLGQHVGLSAATINRYEKLHRGPTAQDLARIENVLGPLRDSVNFHVREAAPPAYGSAGGPSPDAITAGAIVDGLPTPTHRATALRMLTRYAESLSTAPPQSSPPPSPAPPSAQPGRSEPTGASRARDLNARGKPPTKRT